MNKNSKSTVSLKIAAHLIRQYQEEKITLQELATEHEVSVSTIWRELKRRGVSRGSKRGRPTTRDKYPQVIALAGQGWTRRQIAEHLDLTPEWVRCILAEHGLTVSMRILKCRQCGTPVTSGHKAERNEETLCKFCLLKQDHPAFADRLRAFRLAASLSQAQLSQLTGLSQAAIGIYERGQGQPTLESVRKLAHGLGVKVSALLGSVFFLPDENRRLKGCI